MISPEVAVDNLRSLADVALLNGPNRRAIDESLAVLEALAKNTRPHPSSVLLQIKSPRWDETATAISGSVTSLCSV
jgi:hypothetical protein